MRIHLDGDIFMQKCKKKEYVKQKKRGELPENYPENEEQLNRMDPATFEAMMPEVKKIRFDVDVDRMDGITGGRGSCFIF
eukprot:CAMPEP_0201594042 /NCGR_PEP_ID=MMETSP0190_2-20130828/191480_1 /ASSEMBLY_ACC=CAM_ASM_000263 /TAXON_ID=37353 /ORGANISM="Rosalina sp." /LENGTH=79 /DNA_ID=CAMNT_0048053499 /DNA_START=361 /DNA_END=600 /DNA_ORIENTATION=-